MPRARITSLWRVEYDQLGAFAEERLELLEGALVAMSPQHAPHAATIARLTKLLVRRVPDRYEVRSSFHSRTTASPQLKGASAFDLLGTTCGGGPVVDNDVCGRSRNDSDSVWLTP